MSLNFNGNYIGGIPSGGGGTPYILPVASTTTLGGVKIDGETITITNDGVISSTGGGGSITVDDALSDSSENPVQNKVINTALGGKQATIDANNKLSISLVDGGLNTDASNLTTDGQKVFDGQWIGTNNTVYSGDVFQSSTSFDVSSYLPNDNYAYELLVVGYATCTTTNGQTTECDVKGDVMTGGYMACAISTCTNARAVTDAGFGFIIVGSERKIYFFGESARTAGTIKLVIKAYRRVGTNL